MLLTSTAKWFVVDPRRVPTTAWYSPDSQHKYFTYQVEDLERFFAGEPLQHELTERMVEIRNGRL